MPKARSKPKIAVKQVPWWLGTGDVMCPHCGQLYPHELEYRCPDCDEPSCKDCRCPECHSQAHEESEHGR